MIELDENSADKTATDLVKRTVYVLMVVYVKHKIVSRPGHPGRGHFKEGMETKL